MKAILKVYLKDEQGNKDSFCTYINLNRLEEMEYYLDKDGNIERGAHAYFMKCYKVMIS